MSKSRSKTSQALTGKDLFIISVCLLILGGILGNYVEGLVAESLSAALAIGGLISLLASPFALTKENSKK